MMTPHVLQYDEPPADIVVMSVPYMEHLLA